MAEATHLIIQASSTGKSLISIYRPPTPAYVKPFVAIDTSTATQALNPVRQLIIPIEGDTSSPNWMSVITTGASMGPWSIKIVGYIR